MLSFRVIGMNFCEFLMRGAKQGNHEYTRMKRRRTDKKKCGWIRVDSCPLRVHSWFHIRYKIWYDRIVICNKNNAKGQSFYTTCPISVASRKVILLTNP